MMRCVLGGATAALIAACSGAPAGPVVVEQPGRVVVVQQPPQSGSEIDGGDGAIDAMADATDAAVADAAPMTCTGPATKGAASTNCEPVGPCTLSTCTVGQAYACLAAGSTTPAGYPLANIVCVFSASDSKSGDAVHCCEPICVREDRYDGACGSKGPAIPHAMRCPPGIVPSVQHQEVTDQGVSDLYCTP